MTVEENNQALLPTRSDWLERLAGVVATFGGMLSLALAVLVVASITGRAIASTRFASWLPFAGPVEGDFEFIKMGTAIAVYTFLPYTQARRGNIVVDTFTGSLSPRTTALMDAFWDLVYAGVMGVLTYCLWNGTREFIKSGETTMMLQIVIWPAIAACAVLSALLTFVAFMTAIDRILHDGHGVTDRERAARELAP